MDVFQIKDADIIADNAFYSEKSVSQIKDENLKLIIPHCRNNNHICYDIVKSADKKSFEGFFKDEERINWYYSININSDKADV